MRCRKFKSNLVKYENTFCEDSLSFPISHISFLNLSLKHETKDFWAVFSAKEFDCLPGTSWIMLQTWSLYSFVEGDTVVLRAQAVSSKLVLELNYVLLVRLCPVRRQVSLCVYPCWQNGTRKNTILGSWIVLTRKSVDLKDPPRQRKTKVLYRKK